MTSANKIWAVVPAGGRGARMGSELPKQYLQLAGKTILEHTLARLLGEPRIAGVVVPMAAGDDLGQTIVAAHAPRVRTAAGGAERCHSVLNGIEALAAADNDWVLVHDAARCLTLPEQVRDLIDRCRGDAVGGLLALPLPDTLKAEVAGRVAQTLDRSGKWLAQTPQMFRFGALERAIARAQAQGQQITDEASAMEACGLAPLLVTGSAQNFKVTYPADFSLAQAVLQSRSNSAQVPSS